MLATLALLGVGSEAAIPILGYRLFNFWLPIPLAAVFYPTLRYAGLAHTLGDQSRGRLAGGNSGRGLEGTYSTADWRPRGCG
jgi:hypothetical protein